MASLERWHIGKTITFGNLLTGFAAFAAIAVFLFDQSNRISVLETRANETDKHIEEINGAVSILGDQILDRLDIISDKQYYHLQGHSLPLAGSIDAGS